MAQEQQNAPGGTSAPPGSPQSPGQQAPQSPGPQAPASPQAPQSHGAPAGGAYASAGQQGPLPRASFGQRLGAFAIDIAIVVVANLVIGFIFGILAGGLANAGGGAGAGIAVLIGTIGFLIQLIVPLAYFGYMEGQPSGQTVGKRAVNIRVVDFETAGSLTLGRAVLRNLARYLSGFLFGLGYFWMLWDPQGQTWHDKLVTTQVVPTSAYPV